MKITLIVDVPDNSFETDESTDQLMQELNAKFAEGEIELVDVQF